MVKQKSEIKAIKNKQEMQKFEQMLLDLEEQMDDDAEKREL